MRNDLVLERTVGEGGSFPDQTGAVLVEVGFKLVVGVHVAFYPHGHARLLGSRLVFIQVDLLPDVFLVDRRVREVGKLIVQLVWVVVLAREPQVVLGVEPNLELGFPVGDDDPLADVELPALDNERRLDVLLGNPNLVHARPDVVVQVILVAVNLDASAARLPTWFHNPGVLLTVQTVLVRPDHLHELLQHLLDPTLGILWLNLFCQLAGLHVFHKPRLPTKVFLITLLALNHCVINIVWNLVELVVLARHDQSLVWIQDLVAHHFAPSLYEGQTCYHFVHHSRLAEISHRKKQRALQKGNQLAELEFLHEVFELLAGCVRQVVALRKHVVDVHEVLPDQVLHVVGQADLGGQRLGSFEVVDLLERGGLPSARVSALGCIK